MTDVKKASDVILEIDLKIDNLLNFFKNHDNNQKLIISRLDKIYKKLEEMPEDRNFSRIAQDLEEVIPEIVFTDDEGWMSVNYGQMVSLGIGGIQEQKRRVDSIYERINKLKQLISV